MPKTDQITMNSQTRCTNTNMKFHKDIEVLIVKENPYLKHKSELLKEEFICLLYTKASTGLNVDLKQDGRELYQTLTYLNS